MDIIGWCGDGDILCNYCAEERYGEALWSRSFEPVLDSEENPVTPIFAVNEEAFDNCAKCGEVLL